MGTRREGSAKPHPSAQCRGGATLILLCLLLAAPSCVASVVVSDMVFDLESAPGESHTLRLEISNSGTTPTNVSVAYVDWVIEADGNHLFLEPGTLGRSLREHIAFAPEAFRLQGGETRSVRIDMTTPADGDGTYWGMLLVEGDNQVTQGAPGGLGVQIRTRMAVKIYNTVAGNERQSGRIMSLTAVPASPDEPFHASMTFRNTGNVKLRPRGWFELRDLRGQSVWRSEFAGRTVLPDGEIHLTDAYDGQILPAGKYVLIGIVDYGGHTLLGAQVSAAIE